MTPEQTKRFKYWQTRTIVATMIGYALFYFVRKNFSLAMPGLEADLGISKTSLGIFLTLNGVVYGLSRFVNGILADRMNARWYMAVGLALCALANFAFGFGEDVSFWITGQHDGSQFTNTMILFMGIMWVINGLLQGTGFPPCARLLTHWIPPTQLATKMSVWNTSHSIGAGLVVILCGYIMGTLGMKSAGMSLIRITKPLIILVSLISVGSFFIGNNLVPYANKKVFSILYDIRQQKQSLEFQDGLFFNGIDNMSIRVSRQEPETHLLHDVLIYDNRAANGDMNTIVADSGYIRLSDDKKYLLVTLFNGETYEQTRSSQWFTQSKLRHHIFEKQDQVIPMEGFAMGRTDANQFSNSQTKNINELQHDIDSLEKMVNSATTRSYEPLLKEQIFSRDNSVLPQPDSLRIDKSRFRDMAAMDSIATLQMREKERVWNQARTLAKNSRNMFSFDESAAKEALNQLYRSKVEWHKKMSLPVSIMIFFLIGAPLGAIIRKGGLGLPVVVSIIFFVIYYIISLSGEKLAKEGSWDAVYGMWLSTFILTPIAIYLTYKATNDSALLDTDWYAGKFKALYERMRPAINKLKNAIKLKRNGKKHDSE